MLVGFVRYSRSNAFAALRAERSLLVWMLAGSILGTALGAMLLGAVPSQLLITLLGIILLVSAFKTFQHLH
jgi:uncharacterized membrane protein YfcA